MKFYFLKDLLWADPTNNLDPNNGVNSWFNDVSKIKVFS